jgi:DNA-binding FrmR family transcriptional regulator
MVGNTKTTSESGEKRVEQPHKVALRRRMSRIAGQVQGITKMIEEDRYCVDLLVQISAVRSALNQVGMQLVEDHTRGCVRRAIQAGEGDESIAELMDVLRKFAR